MFALFEDGSTIIMGDRRLHCLRLLNQRLWIFALFEDARLQTGTGRRNGLSLLSLLSLKPPQERSTSKGKMIFPSSWETAGFTAFGCSTSGYGYSPPSATLS